MTDRPSLAFKRPRAALIFGAFLAFGVAVFTLVILLTGDWALAAVYGLAPGLGLGLLAWRRARRRGALIAGRRPDSPGRGGA